ncbi:uncharacterized protein [Ptychodera flava]|uniref:uncharacterized protein n=1 Tax=Ptychodera flava TaxID=63121 RepID=UPI003969F85D
MLSSSRTGKSTTSPIRILHESKFCFSSRQNCHLAWSAREDKEGFEILGRTCHSEFGDTGFKTATKMSTSRRKWPIVIRYSLGILGYVKRKNSNNFRRCLPCLLKHKGLENLHELFEIDEEKVAENEGAGDSKKSCPICADLNKTWQDNRPIAVDQFQSTGLQETQSINQSQHDRQVNQVNIQIEGNSSSGNKKKWSPFVQWLISLAFVVIITGLMLSDWAARVVINWGKRDLTLHLLSASTYVLPLVVVTTIRIISMIYEWAPPTNDRSVYALTKGNVLTRLNMCDLSRCTAFGYLSVAFALVCASREVSYQSYRFSHYPENFANNDYIDFVAFIIGDFMFAAFCYEINLLKHCLQSDINLCLLFVKRNIKNGLDLCRQRILATYSEFLKLHNLVSSWLVFQFSISVFKLSCHIYWNYNAFATYAHVTPANLINIIIWCESTMFLLLPIFAVGGFSISYLWNDFKLDCKRMQRRKDGENWHRVVKLLKTLNATESGILLTAFFSILSVFLALKLDKQYGDYWIV